MSRATDSVQPCTARYHLPPASPDATTIRWHAQLVADTARAIAWNCPIHDEDEYQLCERGAVWFIRRRRKSSAIHETLRDTQAVVADLWRQLMAGTAR